FWKIQSHVDDRQEPARGQSVVPHLRIRGKRKFSLVRGSDDRGKEDVGVDVQDAVGEARRLDERSQASVDEDRELSLPDGAHGVGWKGSRLRRPGRAVELDAEGLESGRPRLREPAG